MLHQRRLPFLDWSRKSQGQLAQCHRPRDLSIEEPGQIDTKHATASMAPAMRPASPFGRVADTERLQPIIGAGAHSRARDPRQISTWKSRRPHRSSS